MGLTTFCSSAQCPESQYRKLTFLFSSFCIYDDSFQPVPFTSSKLVDSRLPTQQGKQTSHTSAITSEWPRSNQAVVTIFISLEGPKLKDSKCSAVNVLFIRLVHNTAVAQEAEFQLHKCKIAL